MPFGSALTHLEEPHIKEIGQTEVGMMEMIASRAIDAEPLDDIPRPTAAVAVLGQEPLGREHAIAAHRIDVALEVGLAAEQAKAAVLLSARAKSPPQHDNTTRKARTKTGSIASARSTAGHH